MPIDPEHPQDPTTGRYVTKPDAPEQSLTLSGINSPDALDYFDRMVFSGYRLYCRISDLSIRLGYNTEALQEIAAEVCGTNDWSNMSVEDLDQIITVLEDAWEECGGDTVAMLMREVEAIEAEIIAEAEAAPEPPPDPFAADQP